MLCNHISCKVLLPFLDSQAITLDVICIGALRIYIDGYNQTASSMTLVQSYVKYTFKLDSSTANLIGIQCFTDAGTGAIIARTDSGLVSDSSWKVAIGITEPDWTTACYDDRQWLNAVNITNQTWPQLTGATWISYPGGNPSKNWVFYRKLLRKYTTLNCF